MGRVQHNLSLAAGGAAIGVLIMLLVFLASSPSPEPVAEETREYWHPCESYAIITATMPDSLIGAIYVGQVGGNELVDVVHNLARRCAAASPPIDPTPTP